MSLEPYYHTDGFTLYSGDNCQVLPQLTGQYDMIFADPPYFLSGGGKTVRGKRIVTVNKGDWDQVRSDEEKDQFNMRWLELCRERLKPDGTIWVSGTFHNIYSVERCINRLGYKLLNIITWQKTDPPPSLTETRFNFSSEYIIWAAKSPSSRYHLNSEWLKAVNHGRQMPDVWQLPSVSFWEKTCGRHTTQKPLCLLYRIIMATTHTGDAILDPFAGASTTGIAANLLRRSYTGIEQDTTYLDLGRRRRQEMADPTIAAKMLRKMAETPNEAQVLVNHARPETRRLMIEKGICYLRAGDSQGSLQVTPGFERTQYVLLHTNGEDCQLFRLNKPGTFQIWTRETLEQHGFHPEHAPYYIALHFSPTPVAMQHPANLRQRVNTYRAKIRPLSDFVGI